MKKDKWKKRITFLVLILALFIFIPHIKLKSVSTYQKEKTELAKEQAQINSLPDEKNGSDKSEQNKKEDSQTEKSSDTVSSDRDTEKENEKKNSKKSAKDINKKSDKNKKETDKTEKNNDTLSATSGHGEKSSAAAEKDKSAKNQKNSNNKNSEDKKTHNKKSGTSDKAQTTVKPKATSKPTPAAEKEDDNEEYITCKIAIDCTVLLDNMDKLNAAVHKYVPSDGMILKQCSIKVKKGESAYDALVKACKAYNIVYDAEYTKMYSGSYVKGIGYLYEKMAGDMSGWLYLVNGKVAGVGASKYELKEADSITWLYTCSGRAGY